MLNYFSLSNKAFVIFIAIILCSHYEPVIATNLMDILNYTLYNHPTILFNEQLVEESKYRYYQTFGAFLPEISVAHNQSSEKTYDLSDKIHTPVLLKAHNNIFNLNQNLFTGFKDLHANRAAMWKYKSTQEKANFNINTKIFEIVINYINILEQEKLLKLAKENERFFKNALIKLNKLYKNGTGNVNKADLLLVKNNLQNARENTIQAKQDYDIAILKIKNLTQINPINLQPLKSISKNIDLNIAKNITTTLDNNPNIKELEAKIKILSYELKKSENYLIPSIDLQVSKNKAANLHGYKGNSGTEKVGITFNLNLFKGGQDYLETQAKYAEKLSLDHELEQTKRVIKQETTEAWHNIKNSLNKKKYIDDQITSAATSLQYYLTLFENDRSYLINILSAKKSLLTSQTTKINNNSNKLINEYKILFLNNTLLDTIQKTYSYPSSTTLKLNLGKTINTNNDKDKQRIEIKEQKEYLKNYDDYLNNIISTNTYNNTQLNPKEIQSAHLQEYNDFIETYNNAQLNPKEIQSAHLQEYNDFIETYNNTQLNPKEIQSAHLQEYNDFIDLNKLKIQQQLIQEAKSILKIFNQYIKEYDEYINSYLK